MMRKNINTGILAAVLLGLILYVGGCGQFWAQPGRTAEEGTRDQIRTIKVNHRQLMQDLNHALLLDGPSKLNEMSIP